MEQKNKITIDGKEYILEESIKKLEPIIEKVNFKDYWISDPANVMAIMPFNKNIEIKDELFIEDLRNNFKLVDIQDILPVGYGLKGVIEKFKINGSCYSKELIDICIETSKSFRIYDEPKLFMAYKEDWIKHKPLILFFDRLCFVIAPRVDDSEEE